MGLVDYQPETYTAEIKGGSVTVSALNFNGLGMLVRAHATELGVVFDLFRQAFNGDEIDPSGLAKTILMEAPGLCANLIAVAAGEPGCANVAKSLPFPTQIELLNAIGKLTFVEVGGVKKTMQLLVEMLANLKTEQLSSGQPKTN